MLEKPTIVLLDMDGTIVRHINPWLLSVLEWLDDSAHKLARLASKILRRKIKSPPLVEFHDGKRKKLLVHRAIHKIRRKPVDEIVEPCPGIYDVLEFLQSQNITLGLISNGIGKGYGHDVLGTFDLEKYFSVSVFREDIPRAKPYPDPLLQALRNLDRDPDKNDVIWYIGDRNKDVHAAIAAGKVLPCPVVPVAYNLNAAIAILENGIGADHIFMSWPDVLTRLRHLFEIKPKPGTPP